MLHRYSVKGKDFAERLHEGLQNKGVRCWFAPHDLPIGAEILDGIDEAIRVREKVLLILSEHSIMSRWVKDEVTTAFEEERKRGQLVLFPIRLDDAVMATHEAWAAKLRARNVGDFRHWKDHAITSKALSVCCAIYIVPMNLADIGVGKTKPAPVPCDWLWNRHRERKCLAMK